MKWIIGFFTTPDSFTLLPAITIRVMRCPDPRCPAVHGYDLGLHWGEWGFGIGILFSKDDLT